MPTSREVGSNLLTRLRLKPSVGRVRGDTSLADLVSERSDAYPGQYTCLECRAPFSNIMEAWRTSQSAGQMGSTAALFCAPCAQKLNALGLELSPIELNIVDKLNLGS